MALQAFEGFESLAVSDLPRMYGWIHSSPGASTLPVGRLSGSALLLFSSTGIVAAGQGFFRVLTGTPTKIVVGMAINIASLASFPNLVFGVRGPTSTICTVQITTAGVSNLLNSAGTVIATGGTYVIGTWYYLELSVDIVAGTAELRRDGAVDLLFTGSISAGNAHINRAGIAQFRTTINHRVPTIDDMYIVDGTGASLNSYLGDSRVVARVPTSDSSVQFTPSGVGGNFAQVDEATQNGDTDYVIPSSVPMSDRYASTSAIPGNPVSIYGVGVRVWARKTDATTRAIRAAVRSNISTTVGVTEYLGTEYTAISGYFPADPATGLAWSVQAATAATFGPDAVI